MNSYLENLKNKFSAFFDVFYDYEICNARIDFFATNKIRNEKYFATKNVPIWAYETNEFCILKIINEVNVNTIKDFTELLKESVKVLVVPSSDHMKTVINGVIVSENIIDDDAKVFAQNFKYSKVFKFYLEGWCEIRLVLVEIPTQQVFANKKGKEVMKFYCP